MHQALPPGVPHTVNCIACYAGFLGVGGRGGETGGGERRLGERAFPMNVAFLV